MADRFAVQDMKTALEQKQRPTVTMWNRIEGRPRTINFERALRAEVRDALWMLTRQWQAGEFHGEDAGSPVFTKAQVATTRLTRYQAGSMPPQDFNAGVPLETHVEWRPLQFMTGTNHIALDLRLTLGRRWLKQIEAIGPYAGLFIAEYQIDLPDPARREDAAICADVAVWQSFAAAAGRAMDGVALYRYLASAATHRAYDGVAVLDTDKPALDVQAGKFVGWVRRQFSQLGAADNPAWEPSRFEYGIACADPTGSAESVYVADKYHGGSLDWHSFDVDRGTVLSGTGTSPNPSATITRTLLPVPITYAGMPHPRWWTMEDGRTNFGEIRPDTTDLAKLLFIEFGLVYSNDWFIVPFTVAAGSLVTVQGVAVTTVFGERFWIERAGSAAADSWQRWSLFALDDRRSPPTPETALLFLPTVPKVQEGVPLEEVLMIRDEMANMVWGIEKTIPAADGQGRSGATAGRETRAYHERLVNRGVTATEAPLLQNDAKIRFELMSTVPEHWIPFIAVRASGSQRSMELQRASVPRIIDGDPVRPLANVEPRTSLLRPGLDALQPAPYLVPEEEVPRGGTRVTLQFRRARGLDGQVFVWLAAHKQVGRGEGSGGLSFDGVVDKVDAGARG